MLAPSQGSSTSETQIEVNWNALTGDNTGGVAILSYNLQWDNAGVWADLQGDISSLSTALTYLKDSTGLTAGNSYSFRVRAYNVHGWGPFSSVATIKAASFPSQPSPPTVTLNNILVMISWNDPYANSGTINGYKVFISDNMGTYH